MPAGKGRFIIGAKGTHGCKGYPVVGGEGKVHGCHPTREAAIQQQAAIYASQAREAKKSSEATWTGFFYPETTKAQDIIPNAPESKNETSGYQDCGCETCKALNVDCENCPVCQTNKSVSGCCPDNVEKQSPCWDGYVQRGMKPGANGKMVPNCVPAKKAEDYWEDDDTVEYDSDTMSKADGYTPPAGVRAAARRAIKFKEDGKANGAGTSVGWTRAGQLARGESLSLSTVKRMYSYFSRHEVDKKGKDWGNTANPSNGYIMWLAWGGDAGFSWSRSIVEREKKKTEKMWEGSAFSIRK